MTVGPSRWIYYDDDEGLRDEMVLQPEWLTKAIGFVLEDKETNDKSGELEHRRLRGIWYEHGIEDRARYDPEFHSFFLRLMEKHDVSYRLEGEQASLVTQLVPNVRPDNLPWDIDEPSSEGVGQVSLVCQMDAEPPGLVPWMIVRTHHFATDPRRHWQRGIFLEYDGHGEALLELERYAEALASLERAVALGPENPYAHSHRGQVLFELGRYEEALAAFEQSLRLKPSNAHVERGRERTKQRLGR